MDITVSRKAISDLIDRICVYVVNRSSATDLKSKLKFAEADTIEIKLNVYDGHVDCLFKPQSRKNIFVQFESQLLKEWIDANALHCSMYGSVSILCDVSSSSSLSSPKKKIVPQQLRFSN